MEDSTPKPQKPARPRRPRAPKAPAQLDVNAIVEQVTSRVLAGLDDMVATKAKEAALETVNAAIDDAKIPESIAYSGVGREDTVQRKEPSYNPNDPDWAYQRVDFFSDDVESAMQDRHSMMIDSGWVMVHRTKRRALYKLPRPEWERRQQAGRDAHAAKLFGSHVSTVNERNQREPVITAEVLNEIESQGGTIPASVKQKALSDLSGE